MRRLLLALMTFVAPGCALNAVLEVDMALPFDAAAGDRPFAVVEVEAGAIPESFDPRLAVVDGVSFALDGEDACPEEAERVCNVRFSVTSRDVGLEALYIRAKLCRDPDCTALPADAFPPFYLFEIARPFYRGRVTHWSPNRGPFASSIPLDPQPRGESAEVRYEAHRCEVEGCSEGAGVTGAEFGWCFGPTEACDDVRCRGAHFCER